MTIYFSNHNKTPGCEIRAIKCQLDLKSFSTVYRVSAVVLNGGTGSGAGQQPRLDPKTLWPLVTAASADTAASTAGAGSWCVPRPGPDTLAGLVTATLASAAGFLLAFLAYQQLRRLTGSEERRDNTARRAQTVLEGSVLSQIG